MKTWAKVGIFFLLLLCLVWLSTQRERGDESCLVDGTMLIPISKVVITTADGEERLFCSLCCASNWLEYHPLQLANLKEGKSNITVVDEISGLELDATLAYYIESEDFSRKENRCRVHVFSDKQAASNYLRTRDGRELPGYLAGLGQVLSWAEGFNLQDINGEQRSLGEFQGKIVFLRFFSLQNPFVATDLGNLQEAQQRFEQQGFTVLAVNVEDKQKDVAELAEGLGVTFPILFDSDGKVADRYQITGFPTGFLVDPSGIVDSSSVGEVTADVLAPFLHALQ